MTDRFWIDEWSAVEAALAKDGRFFGIDLGKGDAAATYVVEMKDGQLKQWRDLYLQQPWPDSEPELDPYGRPRRRR